MFFRRMFSRGSERLCFAVLVALALPSALFAQGQTGSIAGTVKDTSGAVLPGVTVEAASPALIEKVRTVVTDGSGAYRIVDLGHALHEENDADHHAAGHYPNHRRRPWGDERAWRHNERRPSRASIATLSARGRVW